VQDLNELVQDQGESLKVVEQNVDAALEKVEAGNQELEVAQTYVSSYRKKCCAWWILVVVLIVAITVPLCIKSGKCGLPQDWQL
jgi:t-SNARE complex subunit (syntaxin)